MVAMKKDGELEDTRECEGSGSCDTENTKCEGCRACSETLRALLDQEKEWMDKSGFYVHLVPSSEHKNGLINAHTHGLKETQGHPDLQVVAPIQPGLVMQVIHAAANRIKDGRTYKDGVVAEGILRGMVVKFLKVRECDRDVLRIILPDPKGRVEKEEMEEAWAMQYQDPD